MDVFGFAVVATADPRPRDFPGMSSLSYPCHTRAGPPS